MRAEKKLRKKLLDDFFVSTTVITVTTFTTFTTVTTVKTLTTVAQVDHCEAGEGYWLQGEAGLQAHSFRDADPQPVIPKKESGLNGLEIATNDKICLEKFGHGRKCI